MSTQDFQKHRKLKTTPPGSSVLAAALQDHLNRQYSILPLLNLSANSNQGSPGVPWTILAVAHLILAIETSSSATRVSAKKCGPSPETNNTDSNIRNYHKEVEYSLDKAPPPLTLAQRLGLVGAPPHLLDEHRWKDVKKSSNARQDSSLPCSICQEEFGLSMQVLLSCSHVFHLACLTSFERFSRSKCCPLCRTKHYQKRVIYEGAQHCRQVAAAKIQAWWRGHVVRRWYREYRVHVPPTHPILRTRHFEKKLSSVTELMVQSCDTRSSQAACILAEADDGLSAIREAMALYDLQLNSAVKDSVAWETIRCKASEHFSCDCSVCLGPLIPGHSHLIAPPHSTSLTSSIHSISSNPPQPLARPLSLLSCGHLLHVVCIEALERFANISTDGIAGGDGDVRQHLCPLCRTSYLRILLEL